MCCRLHLSISSSSLLKWDSWFDSQLDDVEVLCSEQGLLLYPGSGHSLCLVRQFITYPSPVFLNKIAAIWLQRGNCEESPKGSRRAGKLPTDTEKRTTEVGPCGEIKPAEHLLLSMFLDKLLPGWNHGVK